MEDSKFHLTMNCQEIIEKYEFSGLENADDKFDPYVHMKISMIGNKGTKPKFFEANIEFRGHSGLHGTIYQIRSGDLPKLIAILNEAAAIMESK